MLSKKKIEVEKEKTKSCPVLRALKALIGILCPIIGILFIVYFWNLDQKVMTGLYKLVNEVFDEKKVDINF